MQIGTSINNRINTYYGTPKTVRQFRDVSLNTKERFASLAGSEIIEPNGLHKKETETDTDIIVKPDGSRVLVVTVNVGGMKTTMSLEISEPTEMSNDCNIKSDRLSAGFVRNCLPFWR